MRDENAVKSAQVNSAASLGLLFFLIFFIFFIFSKYIGVARFIFSCIYIIAERADRGPLVGNS